MHPVARAGLSALISVAAAAGACATVWWIAVAVGGGYGTAVLATVVALTLSRRTFASRGEFARSAALLPVIGLVAAGVGWLLVVAPVVGAVAFVAGMSVPIWMRRFGGRIARLGALVTLPFTAILVAPGAGAQTGRWWLDLVLLVGASVVAVAWVAVAREVGVLAGVAVVGEVAGAGADARPGEGASAGEGTGAAAATTPAPRRLPASTRMALQMAAALAAAFVAGWLLFPDHAMWTVLTAFIVNSGNRGRGDVVHKSALRVAGALGGTIVAVAFTFVAEPTGMLAVVVIFAALFVGTWLRGYSYAFWALAVTLAVALLQGLLGVAPTGASLWAVLGERVLAIVTGAVIGIAAAWFVLPVRSDDVVRKRLSEMLVALGAVFAPANPAVPRDERVGAFRASLARVEQLAPAHRARRVVGGRKTIRAIDCIEAALALGPAVDARLADGSAGGGGDRGDAGGAGGAGGVGDRDGAGGAGGVGDRDGTGGAAGTGGAGDAAGAGAAADPASARLRRAVGAARKSLAAPADFARIHSALLALGAELDGRGRDGGR